MISAVAFCPHPPVLIPEVAQGAAPELDELRTACRTAITRIAACAGEIVVVGAGERWHRHAPGARGSLAPFGVPFEVALGAGAAGASGPVELPLSLTVGAWLLRDALGPDHVAWGWSVGATDADAPQRLTPDDGVPRSLLVMADGSARRSTSAPGYLDARAAGFDARSAEGLRTGDPQLLRADPALAEALLVAGSAVWNRVAAELGAQRWAAELLYDAAPYGVGYFVAAWTQPGSGSP